MNDNIKKADQRGEHIDDLRDKSDRLTEASKGFHKSAHKTRIEMMKKNMKMWVLIIVGIIAVIVLIVLLGTFKDETIYLETH